MYRAVFALTVCVSIMPAVLSKVALERFTNCKGSFDAFVILNFSWELVEMMTDGSRLRSRYL